LVEEGVNIREAAFHVLPANQTNYPNRRRQSIGHAGTLSARIRTPKFAFPDNWIRASRAWRSAAVEAGTAPSEAEKWGKVIKASGARPE